MTRKIASIVVGAMLVAGGLYVGCGGTEEGEDIPQNSDVGSGVDPTATPTPIPGDPTATPAPTETPLPTATPGPTATPVPPSAPSGIGTSLSGSNITVSWTDDSEGYADSFEVERQISTDNGSSYGSTQVEVVVGVSTTYTGICSGLPPVEPYVILKNGTPTVRNVPTVPEPELPTDARFRVRACKGSSCSDWSPVGYYVQSCTIT
jgi:hypothetical protein